MNVLFSDIKIHLKSPKKVLELDHSKKLDYKIYKNDYYFTKVLLLFYFLYLNILLNL